MTPVSAESKGATRPAYDCDTSGYWCSEADYEAADKRYGRWIDDGEAYEITERDTPRPWLNYLYNDTFGSCISHTGLGFTWYKTMLFRVTRYDHPEDYLPRQFEDGREILIRDTATGASWNQLREAETFRCVHRPGSTRITALHNGIETVLTVFVPLEGAVECWVLEILNRGDKPRPIEVAVEQKWAFAKFGIHTAEEGIPYLTTPGQDVTVTAGAGFVAARAAAADLPFPISGRFASRELATASHRFQQVSRKDGRVFRFPIARLEHTFTLEPAVSARAHVLSAAAESDAELEAIAARFAEPKDFAREMDRVRERTSAIRRAPSCEIPDANLEKFLNVWLKHQLGLTFRFVRSGFVGYRDTCQDTWGYMLIDPARAAESLRRALSHMKPDGTCPRNYSVIDGKHDLRAFMDSGTWLVMPVIDYLRETGDLAFLNERLPYLGSAEEDSVGDHIWRSLKVLTETRGRHGLTLIGEGDWNDALEGISRSGDAESAWLTMALYHACNLAAEIFTRAGNAARVEWLVAQAADLKRALDEAAWDGEWYLYGYTAQGNPIGSQRNKEGFIHLNAQTWAIFTGLADPEKSAMIRASVKKHLATTLGPALLAPPYVHEAAEVGRIARLEPGTFENGSVYQHAVTFQIFADLACGDGDAALRTFLGLLPSNPENFDARRCGEPYALGNYYCGPGHARFGQNFFTWFTASPAWLLRAGFDRILGVRADFDGLRIEPCVPMSWNHFRVTRRFRGCEYDIRFERAFSGIPRGIRVNGTPIEGSVIPPQAGPRAEVSVTF